MNSKSIVAALGLVLSVASVQARTVALWTMAVDGAPVSGTGVAPCSIDSANNLTIGYSGVIGKLAQDAGWTLPPNPDTTSPTVRTLVGSQCLNIVGPYMNHPCARSSSATVVAALTPTNSFTLEGYFFFNKEQGTGDRLMCVNGIGATDVGSWSMSCVSNTTSHCWRFVLKEQLESGRQQFSQISDLTADIPYAELTNGYHHLALTFEYSYPRDATKSEWRFYYDGVCRSQILVSRLTAVAASSSRQFSLFGSSTSSRTDGANPFGHAYYWRVSDKALAGRELLCYGDSKKSHTVAYWPMNNTSGVVPCAVSSVNNLTPRVGGYGQISFTATDIGWTLPPNFAADNTFFTGATQSLQHAVVAKGLAPGGAYHGTFEPKNDVLASELSLRNDFTLEYYYRATALPAANERQCVFTFATTRIGGWVLSMNTADGGATYRFVVDAYLTASKSTGHVVATDIGAAELLDRWNHFALRFKYDNGNGKSEWTLLVNGYRRGTVEMTRLEADPTTAETAQFYISGNSSTTANDMVGNLGCMRISRKALAARELLPFVRDAMAYDGTVVYSSFENAEHRYDQVSEYEVVTSRPVGGVSELVTRNFNRARTVRKAKADASVSEADSTRVVINRAESANGYPFFSYAIDGNELNASDFTVETIVRPNSRGNIQYLFSKSKDGSTTAIDWGVRIDANCNSPELVVNGYTDDEQVYDSGIDILGDRLYHHLAVSYDASAKELSLWVDYGKVSACTVACDLSESGVKCRTPLYFGSAVPNPSDQAKRATLPAVNGSFDAVRVTRRMLGADEMLYMNDNYCDGMIFLFR